MLRKHTLNFTVLFALILIVSCKKNEDAQPAPTPTTPSTLTKTDLITGPNWKVTADVMNPTYYDSTLGKYVSDLYAETPACSKDDYSKFIAGGQLIIYNGATKCDVSEPAVYPNNTWMFTNAETGIELTFNDSTFSVQAEYKLIQLDSYTMKLSLDSLDFGDGIMHTETITFTKM